MSLRRRALLGSAAALAVAPRLASAQAYPDRPIRLVVPYAPGGSTDTSARIVAERLTASLGQQVVVENKPGGGTIIGTDVVAKAKPDGYTILLTPGAFVVNAAFGIALPYDSNHDLLPIVHIVDMPTLIAANNEAPYKSLPEMIAWSKEGTGRIVPFASAGIGSVPHLWGEYLKARTGANLEHVGYKGSAEALRDTLAGHVPLLVDALMPTATPVRAGKLRGIAVAMAKRSPLLSNVPTTSESGLADMEAAVHFGISAPGGTPAELVAKLNTSINAVLSDPAIRQRMEELGFIMGGGSPQAYAETLRSEIAKWHKVIKDANIPPPS
jgi:tripartite-type tricarboxylate transporter receptor subunit TctC